MPKWGKTRGQIVAASEVTRLASSGEEVVSALVRLQSMAHVPRKAVAGVPFRVSFDSNETAGLARCH
jgi:hypothetical protein